MIRDVRITITGGGGTIVDAIWMTEIVDRKRRQSASMITVADDGQGHQLWQWSGDGDAWGVGMGRDGR